MEKKLYKGFSIFFLLFGMFSFLSAFVFFLEPFCTLGFYFYSISGVAFIVLHRRFANMFSRFFCPIIKFCIYLLKD